LLCGSDGLGGARPASRSAQGDVVTNSHVVDGSAEIKVTFFDGQEVRAKLIGRDKRTEVAVIRLERFPKDLVAARLGDSNQIEVGEWVLALGARSGWTRQSLRGS
jgi:serine protease Do